jgi:energy-converting hydrogenase Eha subunit H
MYKKAPNIREEAKKKEVKKKRTKKRQENYSILALTGVLCRFDGYVTHTHLALNLLGLDSISRISQLRMVIVLAIAFTPSVFPAASLKV